MLKLVCVRLHRHRRIAASLWVLVSSLCACTDRDAFTPAANPGFAKGKSNVELLFAGDVSTARGIAKVIDQKGHGNPTFPFEMVSDTLRAADFVYANLECVVSDSSDGKVDKKYTIRSDRAHALGLHTAGFDAFGVANNHALDFSHRGFLDTLKNISRQELLLVGLEWFSGVEPLVVEVGELKLGILAYNPHGDEWRHWPSYPRPARYQIDKVVEDITKLASQVDVVVVSLHWGPELSHEPWPWQVQDAHRMVDAGADIVVGSHPHVIQPIESYGGAVIAYSLGDLVFDKSTPWIRARTNARALLRVRYTHKVRTEVELVPLAHDEHWRAYHDTTRDPSSWQLAAPPTTFWASHHLKEARVSRKRDGVAQACNRYDEEAPKLDAGLFRWLAPRHACGDSDDKDTAALSVARTREFVAGVLQEGLWAAPQGGDVTLSWQHVPLTSTLHLTAAHTDYAIAELLRASPEQPLPAHRVTVAVNGTAIFVGDVDNKTGRLDTRIAVPLTQGTAQLQITIAGPKTPWPGFIVDARAE